jgi:O-methyltransferase involved in polyketide biosynthesis
MESDVGDATLIYCSTQEVEDLLAKCEKELRKGSRFVTLFLPLVGAMPDA